jgi:hypothetical protein
MRSIILGFALFALAAGCDRASAPSSDPAGNASGVAVGGSPTTVTNSQIFNPARPEGAHVRDRAGHGVGGGPPASAEVPYGSTDPGELAGPHPKSTEKPGGPEGLSGIYGSEGGAEPTSQRAIPTPALTEDGMPARR